MMGDVRPNAPDMATMIGTRLIRISAVYLILGVVLGLSMGIARNFSLTSVHAHMLLLGWAGMAVSGVVYQVTPRCAGNRLASLHFWGHNLGLPVMMASLTLQAYGQQNAEVGIAVSSFVVVVSLTFFAVNVILNGGAVAQ